MSLATTRAAIAAALNTGITGMRAYAYTQDRIDPSPLVAMIGPPEGDFAADLDGDVTYRLPLIVCTGPRTDLERCEQRIDALCEPDVINDLLNGNLGGAVDSCSVTGFDAGGTYEFSGVQFVGVTFHLEVFA